MCFFLLNYNIQIQTKKSLKKERLIPLKIQFFFYFKVILSKNMYIQKVALFQLTQMERKG